MKTFLLLVFFAVVVYVIYRAYQSSQEESREQGTAKSLPPSVQQAVINMDTSSKSAFFSEYEKKRKKKWVGWLLWLCFGFHYIYYGQVGMQFAYWFTGAGLGIWALVDLFRMPSIARSANEQIARQAIQTLQLGTSFGQREAPLPTASHSS